MMGNLIDISFLDFSFKKTYNWGLPIVAMARGGNGVDQGNRFLFHPHLGWNPLTMAFLKTRTRSLGQFLLKSGPLKWRPNHLCL